MKGMLAVNDPRLAGRGARKFQRCFDRLRSGIGEEHLLEIRRVAQQALGQYTGQRGNVHLHEIGKFGVEHLLESVADDR